MSPTTDKSGQIQKKEEAPQTAVDLVKAWYPAIKSVLPRHMKPERMGRLLFTIMRTNTKIAACDPYSLIGSIMQTAQLGLEPNTPLGHCYLIPFKHECTVVIGYQGMIELVMRSGKVSSIYAHAVFAADEFRYEFGLNPDMTHVPNDEGKRNPKDITHVYAVARIKDGDPIFTVLTREQVDQRRNRSAAKSSGPWVTDYEEMAKKTAIRMLFKSLPKSAEIAQAIVYDEALESGHKQTDALDPGIIDKLDAEGIMDIPSTPVETVKEEEPDEKKVDKTGEIKDGSGLSDADKAQIEADEAAEQSGQQTI